MARQVWFACFIALVFMAIAGESFAARNINFEVSQIITETKMVVASMNRERLQKYSDPVSKQLQAVQNEFRANGDSPQLKRELLRLRGKISRLHAQLDMVWGYYVGQTNTVEQTRLLKFTDRILKSLDNVKRRITSIIGK